MALFYCPYFEANVERTDERYKHISARHPDLIPTYYDTIKETLFAPDEIRRSERAANTQLFAKWFDEVREGKYVVVVIVSESNQERHWVITAYIARRLSGGIVEWKRN